MAGGLGSRPGRSVKRSSAAGAAEIQTERYRLTRIGCQCLDTTQFFHARRVNSLDSALQSGRQPDAVRPEFPGCGRTTPAFPRRGSGRSGPRPPREQDGHNRCVSIASSLVQWSDTIFIRGARTNAHLQELLHSFDMAALGGAQNRNRAHACIVDATP